jgi:NAD(P)-dependent dehydrogenase (short-subunit alcohol dehydrogenase family)
MARFSGKVVLITGGNAGIGRATALLFAHEGAKVVVAARREDEGIAAVKEIQKAGGTATFVRTDIAKESEIAAAVAHAVKSYGRIDVLFNNAGIGGKNGPIQELAAADFDETFDVNVRGTWLFIKHALPELVKTGGNVVNNSSIVGDVGIAGMSVYSASKGAVNTLTRSLAIELIKQGVRVNAVSPGPIATEMAMKMFGGEANLQGFAKGIVPVGSAGVADDIAHAVLYLASPEAKFVVGQILTVDGGLTAQ